MTKDISQKVSPSFSRAKIIANISDPVIAINGGGERALFEAHQRLDALMRALPVGVSFSNDPTCQSIAGNPAVLAQFEVKSEDNLSASALDPAAAGRQVHFYKEDRLIADSELPLQRAVAENREIPCMELEVQLPSGRRWFAEGYGAPVRDAQGKVVGGVAVTVDVSERKLAQEQLQEAHRKLENVLNSISDGLAVLDRDWRYTYFNRQGGAMLGMRPEDVVGKCAWDLFPHAEGTKFYEGYHRAVETGEAVHFEEFYPDPLNKWIECHCYPSAEGLSVYFRDITARKRSEVALRNSEERFRKLFESDLMGIGIPNRFGAFTEANDELLRMVGYSREDLEAGRVRWDTMTPPEYADLDRAHIAEAAQRGSCTPYEKEYIRKDGGKVPILCGYALLEGSKDEYVGFVLDLSAQKEAEAGLREREQRFRVLAESLPDFVWIREADGKYVYCNQRLLDYVGKPAEWLQRQAFDAVHPDDVSSTIQKWNHSLETGEPYLNEYRLRRYDGEYRYFLARAVPVRNEAGQIDRWLGSSTDIHDRRLAEEALRRSEKLATAGRLAASIAHEINNPLAAVTNALYLAMQEQGLSEQARAYLTLADQELARVAHVTTQTLRFHKQSSAPTLVDVGEVMDSVFTLFAPRFKASGITVEREYLASEKLHCFNDELRQVFANLVGNALDATPRGGKVRLRIKHASPCNGTWSTGIRVVVADTGHGIPFEVRRKLFEPFVSTKGTTGTGLGLWVTESIVRKHGGRIAFRSRTDPKQHGTVFALFLPFDGVKQHTRSKEAAGNTD